MIGAQTQYVTAREMIPMRGQAPRVEIRRSPPGFVNTALGPVIPSFRALSGRLKFTIRHHKFNKDSLFFRPYTRPNTS